MSEYPQIGFLKFRPFEAVRITKSIRAFFLIFLMHGLQPLFAATNEADDAPVRTFLGMESNTATIVITAIIVLFIAVWLAIYGSKMISKLATRVSAERALPYDKTVSDYAFMPSLVDKKSKSGRNVIKTKKGFDINIIGKAKPNINAAFRSATFAVKPTDFNGISPIPKLLVAEGDEVKAGDALFYDKMNPDIMFTSPVSGEVVRIDRGEKRSISQVVVLADDKNDFKDFGAADVNNLSRNKIIARMMESGVWPMINQRPFSTIADPADRPKMVYISTFDTSPLAPDYNFTLKDEASNFQAGVEVLNAIGGNNVHLGLSDDHYPAEMFLKTKNVTHHWFSGPHPSGNVGVQIHHVNPINKGETVWVVNPQDVVIIGRLFSEGRYNTEKIVAIAGPEIKAPGYVKTFQGACIEEMVKDNLVQDHVRLISGNVLTGSRIEANGYLGFSDNLLSVIEEGDRYEFFGWLLPSYPRPSISPTFLSSIFQGIDMRVNTNLHGEHRAFVWTGLYEKVLPMDIYPLQLFKAIMAEDIEKMEGLGIYEIDKEDIALCEFVCPSKSDLQDLVQQGLDLMREQG